MQSSLNLYKLVEARRHYHLWKVAEPSAPRQLASGAETDAANLQSARRSGIIRKQMIGDYDFHFPISRSRGSYQNLAADQMAAVTGKFSGITKWDSSYSSHPVTELPGPSGLQAVSQHGLRELLDLALARYPGRRA